MSNKFEFELDYDFNGRTISVEIEAYMGKRSFNYYEPDGSTEIYINQAYYKDTMVNLNEEEIIDLKDDDYFLLKASEIAGQIDDDYDYDSIEE